MLEVFLRPPIGKPALGVKLAALIVKTVADLMTYDRSNRTVVVRGIGIRIEKRRLKNRSRKIQCILHGEIYGVHRLRSHPPLSAIDRLVELAKLAAIFKRLGTLSVPKSIAFDNFQLRVILPTIGIAHSDLQRAQLLFRFHFRFRGHPGERVDPLAERLDQIVHHRFHFGFGLGRKVALHVQLSDGVSERRIRKVHSALPSWAKLLYSA